jgi:hypothetical protein
MMSELSAPMSASLRDALHARPFVPFTIHIQGGRALRVPEPDRALVTPSGRSAAVVTGQDGISIVDLLHVTRIEFAGERG